MPMPRFLLIGVLLTYYSLQLNAQNNKYVAFHAKEQCLSCEGTDKSKLGHAFVSLGYEDEEKQMTVSDGAWGLYPTSADIKEVMKNLKLGPLPGEVRDDSKKNADYTFVIVATPEEYAKVKKVLAGYTSEANYKLIYKDCLTMMIDVLEVFKGRVKIPDRFEDDNIFPAPYVKTLSDMND